MFVSFHNLYTFSFKLKKIGDQILIITYSLVLVISSDMFAFQVIICGMEKKSKKHFKIFRNISLPHIQIQWKLKP